MATGQYDVGATTPGATAGGGTSSAGGAADSAKEHAAAVGETAKEQAGQVTSTAKEQAGAVVGEVRTQARDLLGEARAQAGEQAGAQRDRLAEGLRTLSGELRSMAEQGGQGGLASELARQAAERSQGAADYLQGHDLSGLVEEVRDFARRRPGAFLLGAAVAGLVAGRLTRGAVDEARSGDGSPAATPGTPARPVDVVPPVTPVPPTPAVDVPPVGTGTSVTAGTDLPGMPLPGDAGVRRG